MTKQYKDSGAPPKIVANVQDKKEKDIERRMKDLANQVSAQQEMIDRIHRDIVRLRVAINEVAARIK
jgi:hypothetical protein